MKSGNSFSHSVRTLSQSLKPKHNSKTQLCSCSAWWVIENDESGRNTNWLGVVWLLWKAETQNGSDATCGDRSRADQELEGELVGTNRLNRKSTKRRTEERCEDAEGSRVECKRQTLARKKLRWRLLTTQARRLYRQALKHANKTPRIGDRVRFAAGVDWARQRCTSALALRWLPSASPSPPLRRRLLGGVSSPTKPQPSVVKTSHSVSFSTSFSRFY